MQHASLYMECTFNETPTFSIKMTLGRLSNCILCVCIPIRTLVITIVTGAVIIVAVVWFRLWCIAVVRALCARNTQETYARAQVRLYDCSPRSPVRSARRRRRRRRREHEFADEHVLRRLRQRRRRWWEWRGRRQQRLSSAAGDKIKTQCSAAPGWR